MNLYMISLGGKVKGCNIEVHDVQFVAANQIDETIGLLKNNWYGMPDKLHMDSYKMIAGADGYEVQLTLKKPENNRQLYFIHMGAYRTETTQEQHDIGLLVGGDEKKVKERALNEIIAADLENHVDSIIPLDSCLLSVDGKMYYIDLIKSSKEYDRKPDWFGYRRLDRE